MYSTLGSMVATALIKLSPIHQRLSQLEVRNIQDFFNSDFISPERRRQIDRFSGFMMAYFNAIRRTTRLTKKARQDYYALQRQGCFVARELSEPQEVAPNQTPILVVPGLNTPTVFFREMQDYFTSKGYPVFVMNLPANGLADVADSAEAIKAEVARIQARCQTDRINIIGHCLGGLIAHYWLEHEEQARKTPVQSLISLGTGFLGAEGVQQLKNLWIPRNPGKPIPRVFDELIQAQMNMVRYSTQVARHNLLTIWDFMVHFRKGLQESPLGDGMRIAHHIIDDPDIDHLTLVLNHKVFERIESILAYMDGEESVSETPKASSGLILTK